MKLKRLEMVNCGMMEEVISIDEMVDKMPFPQLNHLKLQNLQNLTEFCNAVALEFLLSIELFISNCLKLDTFFSMSEDQNHCTTLSFFNDKVIIVKPFSSFSFLLHLNMSFSYIYLMYYFENNFKINHFISRFEEIENCIHG